MVLLLEIHLLSTILTVVSFSIGSLKDNALIALSAFIVAHSSRFGAVIHAPRTCAIELVDRFMDDLTPSAYDAFRAILGIATDFIDDGVDPDIEKSSKSDANISTHHLDLILTIASDPKLAWKHFEEQQSIQINLS